MLCEVFVILENGILLMNYVLTKRHQVRYVEVWHVVRKEMLRRGKGVMIQEVVYVE